MIHGENIILSIDGKQIAGATDCELNVDQNFIQVCSPVSGRWREFVPSDIGWTASISMMVVTAQNAQAWLEEMKLSQTPLTMRYYDTTLGIYQVGQCWIQSWKNSGSVGKISTFSMELLGVGELRKADERDFPIVIGDTMFTKWAKIADNIFTKVYPVNDIGSQLSGDNFINHTT